MAAMYGAKSNELVFAELGNKSHDPSRLPSLISFAFKGVQARAQWRSILQLLKECRKTIYWSDLMDNHTFVCRFLGSPT